MLSLQPESLALLKDALALFDDLARQRRRPVPFTFGGGTVLAARWQHRDSRDIDLFVTDGTVIGALAPDQNTMAAEWFPDWRDDGGSIKLVQGMLDLDVIAARPLSDPAFEMETIDGIERPLAIETSLEIMAKKIRFRAARFTPRDLFDLLAFAELEASLLPGLWKVAGPRATDVLAMRLPDMAGQVPDFPGVAIRRRELGTAQAFAALLDALPRRPASCPSS